MLCAQSAGVALWIVYGVAIGAAPVILANVCTLVLSVALLLCKRLFGTRRSAETTTSRAL